LNDTIQAKINTSNVCRDVVGAVLRELMNQGKLMKLQKFEIPGAVSIYIYIFVYTNHRRVDLNDVISSRRPSLQTMMCNCYHAKIESFYQLLVFNSSYKQARCIFEMYIPRAIKNIIELVRYNQGQGVATLENRGCLKI